MTFTITIGKYGGFYAYWGYCWRICLGWIAISFMPFDLDELLREDGAATTSGAGGQYPLEDYWDRDVDPPEASDE